MPEVTKDAVILIFEGMRLLDDQTVAGARIPHGHYVRIAVRDLAARRMLPFPPPSLRPGERHGVSSVEMDKLVQACQDGSAAKVVAALEAGAAVNDLGFDLNGRLSTPLRAAVFFKDPDVVALLLSRGGDPNGDKVMYSGVVNGTPVILQQLLDAGGDVNAEISGRVPRRLVFVAVASADEAVVRVLLSHPTLDLSVTMEGKTAEECAREWGRTAVADMIHDEVRPRLRVGTVAS